MGTTFIGKVTCECPGLAGGANTSVFLRNLTTPATRNLSTDGNGIVRADGLTIGRYQASVFKPSFGSGLFEFTVEAGASERTLELRLDPGPEANRQPLVSVTSVRLPLYPARARASNIEGDVRLRVSLAGNVGGDINVEARSTELGVRAWRFNGDGMAVQVIDFHYRLLPGDCSADQRTVVTIRFPFGQPAVAEIVARRVIPRGPDR